MYEERNMVELVKKEEPQRKSAYKTRSFVSRGAVTVPLNNGCHFQLVLNNNTSSFGSPNPGQPTEMCLKRLPNGSHSNKSRNRTRNSAPKLREPCNAKKKLLEPMGNGMHAVPDTKLPFWVLTGMAINCLKHKRGAVKEIYEFIEHYFPYHESLKVNWKNSVRHCLTYSRFFTKFNGDPSTPILGCHFEWTFADGTENAFWEQVDMITKRFNNPAECGMAYPDRWSQVTGGRAMSWVASSVVNEDKKVCEVKPLPYSPAILKRSQNVKPLPYSPANRAYAEEKPPVLQKLSVWEPLEEKPLAQLNSFSADQWMVPDSLSPIFSGYGGSQENSPQSPLTPYTFAVPVYSGFSSSPITPFPRFSSDAWSTPFSVNM